MPSLICKDVFNLMVSLYSRKSPGVFMTDSMTEQCTFDNQIFGCGKVYYSNTIITTILMKTLLPNC